MAESLSIPPIELDETKMGRTELQRGDNDTDEKEKGAASLKMFSAKIAKSAEQFGHNIGGVQEKKKNGSEIGNESGMDGDAFATMVVHRDGHARVAQSQLSGKREETTSVVMAAESTQTMLVKESTSLDEKLAGLRVSDGMLSEDSDESSEDTKDPIDASEDSCQSEEVITADAFALLTLYIEQLDNDRLVSSNGSSVLFHGPCSICIEDDDLPLVK